MSSSAPPVCVLLVRVDPSDESECLGLDGLSLVVLRVRHALPALERMRIVRPRVVVIGHGVSSGDVERLTDMAQETGSRVIQMGAFVKPAALREALSRVVGQASARCTLGDDDLPVSKRSGVPPASSRAAGGRNA
jgi:hypothetical protein